MAESLVAMLIIVPVVLFIYGLGKYLDVKDMTFQSSRYSAWQATVGDNPSEVVRTTKERFFMSPYAGFEGNADSSISWKESSKLNGDRWGRMKSHRNTDLETEDSENLVDRDNLQLFESESGLDQEVWSRGVKRVQSEEIDTSFFTKLVSSAQHATLKVNSSGVVESKVEVPLGETYLLNMSGPSDSEQFSMSTTLALVTDPWVPANDADFTDRVNDMVLLNGDAMKVTEFASSLGEYVPDSSKVLSDFKSASSGNYSMASESQSEILPCNRVKGPCN